MSSKSEIWDWFYPRKNVLFWKKGQKVKGKWGKKQNNFSLWNFLPQIFTPIHIRQMRHLSFYRTSTHNTTIPSPLQRRQLKRIFFEKFDPRSQSRMRCYGWRYFSLSTLTYGLQFLIWWHHSSFPFLDGKHEELFAELHTDQEATLFILSNANKTKIKTSFMCLHIDAYFYKTHFHIFCFFVKFH